MRRMLSWSLFLELNNAMAAQLLQRRGCQKNSSERLQNDKFRWDLVSRFGMLLHHKPSHMIAIILAPVPDSWPQAIVRLTTVETFNVPRSMLPDNASLSPSRPLEVSNNRNLRLVEPRRFHIKELYPHLWHWYLWLPSSPRIMSDAVGTFVRPRRKKYQPKTWGASNSSDETMHVGMNCPHWRII